MVRGDILRMRSYRHQGEPGDRITSMDFSAPASKDIIAIHLGTIGRKAPIASADVTWKLNHLGWYSVTQLTEYFGDEACRAMGKAIDAQRGLKP